MKIMPNLVFKWRPALAVAIAVVGFLAAIVSSPAVSLAAATRLLVVIDKSQQSMKVSVDGWRLYVWRVSTARRGYRTPNGTFRPIRLERVWYSTKYDFAPMPNSIFFLGGYAIHGTTEIRNLGRPVSHGCVRLDPNNAHLLFSLVRQYGFAATKIVIRP